MTLKAIKKRAKRAKQLRKLAAQDFVIAKAGIPSDALTPPILWLSRRHRDRAYAMALRTLAGQQALNFMRRMAP